MSTDEYIQEFPTTKLWNLLRQGKVPAGVNIADERIQKFRRATLHNKTNPILTPPYPAYSKGDRAVRNRICLWCSKVLFRSRIEALEQHYMEEHHAN